MGNGSCIEFRIEVTFGNNEMKMVNNQINSHHVQKDNFEFIENGDHGAQDQCSLWDQKNKNKSIYSCFM